MYACACVCMCMCVHVCVCVCVCMCVCCAGTEPWERNLPDFVASARGKKRSSRRSKHNKYTQPPEPPQLPHPASPVRPSSASPGPSEWTRSSLGLWMRPAPSIRSNLAAARVAQQQTSDAATGASAASAASRSVASTSNKNGLALRVVQLAGELSRRVGCKCDTTPLSQFCLLLLLLLI